MGVKRLKELKRKVETSNKFRFESELWNIITNYCLPKFVGLDYFRELWSKTCLPFQKQSWLHRVLFWTEILTIIFYVKSAYQRGVNLTRNILQFLLEAVTFSLKGSEKYEKYRNWCEAVKCYSNLRVYPWNMEYFLGQI